MSGVRLLRGRCVIREDKRHSSILFTPDADPRSVKWHRGKVLALGPPATLPNGTEVPWGFGVGADVLFFFGHLEKLTTREWPEDGLEAVWMPQESIAAVLE